MFNEYRAYSNEARALADRVDGLIGPIVDEFMEQGFSRGDIFYIISEQTSYHIAVNAVKYGFLLRKKETE